MTQSLHRHEARATISGTLHRLARWLCAWACVVALESAAHGEVSPRLVFVHSDETSSPLVQRLRVDLTRLGVEMVEASDTETTDPIGFLSDVAARAGAFAAVRVVSTPAGTTVWGADRATSTTLVRTVTPADPPIEGEIIAIQAVEFVRASLMDLQRPRSEPKLPGREANAEEPRVAPLPDRGGRSAGRLRIALSPAVLFGSKELGPSLHAQIAIGYRWTERVASRAFILLPVLPSTLRQTEGSAEIRATVAGLAGDLDLLSPKHMWQPRLSAELAIVQLRTEGRAAPAFVGQEDTVYAAMPIVRAALIGRLTPWMGLSADVLGGMTLPRPYVTFADRRVANWGRPVAGASLGLQFEID